MPDQKFILAHFLNYLKRNFAQDSEHYSNAEQALMSLHNTSQEEVDNAFTGSEDESIIGMFNLEDIWREGVKVLQEKEKKENDNPEFKAFINVLTEKGYFKGSDGKDIPRGTAAYNERFQKAKARFSEKEQSTKAQAETHKTEGNELVRQGKYEEAVRSYKKAIQCDGNNAVYHANLAAAYLSMKKFDDTVAAGKKALEIDPNYAKAAQRIGVAYEKMDNKDEAIRYFQKAVDLDPSNVRYQDNLRRVKTPVSERNAPGAGPGGMPDMSNMFGGNGMPNLGSMGEMFNNPQFMEMAQNLMQNEDFQRVAQNMMSGMGFDPSEVQGKLIDAIREDENSDSEKVQDLIKDIEDNGPEVIQNYVSDPEIRGIVERARDKIMPGINEMASKFGGQQ